MFVCSLCILWFWMWVWNRSILSVQHWGRGVMGSRSKDAVITVMEILHHTLFNRPVVIGVAQSPSSVAPKGKLIWWGNTEGQTWEGGQSYQTCSGFPLSILSQEASRKQGEHQACTFCKCLRQQETQSLYESSSALDVVWSFSEIFFGSWSAGLLNTGVNGLLWLWECALQLFVYLR